MKMATSSFATSRLTVPTHRRSVGSMPLPGLCSIGRLTSFRSGLATSVTFGPILKSLLGPACTCVPICVGRSVFPWLVLFFLAIVRRTHLSPPLHPRLPRA